MYIIFSKFSSFSSIHGLRHHTNCAVRYLWPFTGVAYTMHWGLTEKIHHCIAYRSIFQTHGRSCLSHTLLLINLFLCLLWSFLSSPRYKNRSASICDGTIKLCWSMQDGSMKYVLVISISKTP